IWRTHALQYTYDGADLLFEKDEGDTLRIRYLYGPGIDHILESVDSVGTKQHFADALGSVTRITDSTGARYKLMVYSSYGVMSTDSGSVLADYVSYTGREAERDLGIYYYRARYYDPLTGRFMVRDPIDFYGGDINLYRYVRNNPVNITDAMGLKINWRNFNPVNPNVRRNFELLNEAIMAMGYPDDSFTLYVTGGDRHPNRFGIHVDLGDGKEVPDSDSKSPHLLSRGARAIDFKLIGLNITPSEQRSIIDCALLKTEFAAFNTEPKNEYGTEPVYEKGHIHIALPMSEFPQKYYMYDLPQRPISDYLRTTLR
ncbi:MAG: RHS repeat-associated core domain-containing protein, partial [Candidatus Zixiibacteriota bacterium]